MSVLLISCRITEDIVPMLVEPTFGITPSVLFPSVTVEVLPLVVLIPVVVKEGFTFGKPAGGLFSGELFSVVVFLCVVAWDVMVLSMGPSCVVVADPVDVGLALVELTNIMDVVSDTFCIVDACVLATFSVVTLSPDKGTCVVDVIEVTEKVEQEN